MPPKNPVKKKNNKIATPRSVVPPPSPPQPSLLDDKIIPSTVFVYDTETLVLLLKGNQMSCIIQALDLLYLYISRHPELCENLVENGLTEDIVNAPYFEYPYYDGAKFRMLTKLHDLYTPLVRDYIISRRELFDLAMGDAIETDDAALKAYSLLFLAHVTRGLDDLLFTLATDYNMDVIFYDFLLFSDIDVQNNALDLMKNFLTCDKTAEIIWFLPHFGFQSIRFLCLSRYPAIQNNALDCLNLITAPDRDIELKRMFIKENGLETSIHILYMFAWRDIHPKVLQILGNVIQLQEAIEKLGGAGVKKLTGYLDFIEDDDLTSDMLNVILKLSSEFDGKRFLLYDGFVELLCNILIEGTQDTKHLASECLRVLADEPEAAEIIVEKNPVKTLHAILLDEEDSLKLRSSALCTLNTFVKLIPRCSTVLADPAMFAPLVDFLELPFRLPLDNTCILMETISSVISFPAHLTKVAKHTLTINLLRLLEETVGTMQMIVRYAVEILGWTMQREVCRDWFMGYSGVNTIMRLLCRAKDRQLLDVLGFFFTMVGERDYELSEAFNKAGLIKWLIDNKPLWRDSPKLETALNSLFQQNLSVKFEYLGYLDINDITYDGFYACRAESKKDLAFPLICDITRNTTCPVRPIYLISYGLQSPPKKADPPSLQNVDVLLMDDEQRKAYFDKMLKAAEENMPILKKETSYSLLVGYPQRLLCSTLEMLSFICPEDPSLSDYYYDVKKQIDILAKNERGIKDKFKEGWVRPRVEILAELVARVMTGPDEQATTCTYHTLELHIAELKNKLETSVIPIGHLRAGLKFERALLFKSLADRIGLPCSLVRGAFAVAWNEVAIPKIPAKALYKSIPESNVEPNYIVDLIDKPGNLLPKGSEEADTYCGSEITSKLTNKPRFIWDDDYPYTHQN